MLRTLLLRRRRGGFDGGVLRGALLQVGPRTARWRQRSALPKLGRQRGRDKRVANDSFMVGS
jgi:hypothetical protein